MSDHRGKSASIDGHRPPSQRVIICQQFHGDVPLILPGMRSTNACHEATQVHPTSWWCGGGVAALGARTTASAHAAHRRAHTLRRRRTGIPGPNRRIPAEAAAVGLDHWRQCADRLPIQWRCRRPRPPICCGTGCARAGRDSRSWLIDGGPLLQATRTVPIVFVQVVDPVGAGYVSSLAKPGGNITGFTNFEYSL